MTTADSVPAAMFGEEPQTEFELGNLMVDVFNHLHRIDFVYPSQGRLTGTLLCQFCKIPPTLSEHWCPPCPGVCKRRSAEEGAVDPRHAILDASALSLVACVMPMLPQRTIHKRIGSCQPCRQTLPRSRLGNLSAFAIRMRLTADSHTSKGPQT